MEYIAEESSFYILPHYYKTGLVHDFVPNIAEKGGIGGTSMDFYADMGIPYCYTVELPDFGQFGVLLPSSMIKVVSINVINGSMELIAPFYIYIYIYIYAHTHICLFTGRKWYGYWIETNGVFVAQDN